MDDRVWPSELHFLRSLVQKYAPADLAELPGRLELATPAEWNELNEGILQLLQPENIALYERLLPHLAEHHRGEHDSVVALVDAVMPIRGGGTGP